MRVTGNTPDRVKKIYIQGSQQFSTFHFDDSQGPPKDGISFHVQGSSAAGEAAALSVARETAVSFSPPPKRVPPRPSNVTRKRKQSVADFGDDDDDFVGAPPRPPTSSSKVTKVDVRKIKKSKSSLAGPKHPEHAEACAFLPLQAHVCSRLVYVIPYWLIDSWLVGCEDYEARETSITNIKSCTLKLLHYKEGYRRCFRAPMDTIIYVVNPLKYICVVNVVKILEYLGLIQSMRCICDKISDLSMEPMYRILLCNKASL